MEELIIPTRAPIVEEPKKTKHIPNQSSPKRGRRNLKKRMRDSHGRNRVLEERREAEEKREKKRLKKEAQPTPPEEVMWREFIEEAKENAQHENPTKLESWVTVPFTKKEDESPLTFRNGETITRTRVRKVDEREFQPTPPHLIGVETHPVNYEKNESYHHQSLEKPSHLWCDEVHATDADVRKGNPTKAID